MASKIMPLTHGVRREGNWSGAAGGGLEGEKAYLLLIA